MRWGLGCWGVLCQAMSSASKYKIAHSNETSLGVRIMNLSLGCKHLECPVHSVNRMHHDVR